MFAPSTLNEIQLFLYAIVGSLDRYIVVDTLRSYDPIRNNFRPPKLFSQASKLRASIWYLPRNARTRPAQRCVLFLYPIVESSDMSLLTYSAYTVLY